MTAMQHMDTGKTMGTRALLTGVMAICLAGAAQAQDAGNPAPTNDAAKTQPEFPPAPAPTATDADAQSDDPQDPPSDAPPPGTRPSDPNAVLGGTTTFPQGQNPIPGAFAGPLSDWSGPYAEATIGSFNTTESSSGATGRLGFQTRRFVGFEGEYTAGLSDITVNIAREARIKSVIAGFARVRFAVDDRIGLFARIGYHETTVDFTDRVFERDEDGFAIIGEDGLPIFTGEIDEFSRTFDGLATGLGAEFSVTENLGVRVEFSRYEISDFETLNLLSIGGQVHF